MNFDRRTMSACFERATSHVAAAALVFAAALTASWPVQAASHSAGATPAKPTATPAATPAAAPATATPAAAPAPAAAAPAAASCNQQATEKKLAGAAKNSFLTKCEREATERCEAAATERKLAGAARTGNINKCVKEAVGG